MKEEELLSIIEKTSMDGIVELDLSNKQLTSLPPEIGKLTNLKALFLSGNQLTSLPPEIGKLTNLEKLSIRNNNLKSLPPELWQLTNLTRLFLSRNKLRLLPSGIRKLTKLERLHLRRNDLDKLPPEIGNLTNLKGLHLGWNRLTSLPQEIEKLTKLKVLRLEGNPLPFLPPKVEKLTNLKELCLDEIQLTTFPPEIVKLTNLERLSLERNQLISLPQEIYNLTNLTSLKLQRNQLTSIPPEIGKLTNLTELSLFNNKLTELPPEIGKLTSLTKLDLHNNKFTELPPEIGKLTNLIKLRLSENPLTSLPSEIGNLTNLTKLYLYNNQLTSLPSEIWKLTGLIELYLTRNQLASLPTEIGNLTRLTRLYVKRNQLKSLPPEISKLTNLTKLYLGGNQLKSLPPEIGKLTNLTELSLSNNQLVSLPSEIGDLKNLIRLGLRGNQLISLPSEIGKLTSLTELDIYSNRLSSLPPEIWKLTSLTTLNVYCNQLTSLSPECGNLTNLNTLVLYGNQLTELPVEMGRLTNLRHLSLERNPLEMPPPEVVSYGVKAVIDYLRRLEESETRYEAKLLLVGQGGVGKTCLSRTLRGEKFENQPTTMGIEVRNWSFPHPDALTEIDKIITLRLWDFEGQEIMHTTHQFFLTERSLYLLVFNTRLEAEAGRLSYWLETIRSRAPDARVIIVATEAEEHQPSPGFFAPLKERFSDLIVGNDFYRIGCKTGAGTKELRQKIARYAANLELMGHLWPKAYVDVESVINKYRDEEGKAYITRNELNTIMVKAGVEEDEFDVLARVLGDLGTITHFPDSPDLEYLIILKPEWLTKAISLVLDHQPLAAANGLLEHRWLVELWSEEYTGLIPVFHKCMEEFELCYRLEGEKHKSLVPLRFPSVKPQIQWKEDLEVKSRSIVYALNFIPAGVITRFIVKTHRMSTGIYWDEGVFLEKDGSQMLCRLDREERKIKIEVRAAFPQNLLERLCEYLDSVLELYTGLKVERRLVCTGTENKECTGEFSNQAVKYSLKKGHEELACYTGEHQVKTLELVYGLTSFYALDRGSLTLGNAEIAAWLESNEKLTEVAYGLEKGHQEMVEMLHWQFVGIVRKVDEGRLKECPGLVSIVPKDGSLFDPRNWISKKYSLRLYCQCESGIHPVGTTYQFSAPEDWWIEMRPYISAFIKILRTVAGMNVPTMPGYLSGNEWQTMKDDLNLMKDLLGAIPDEESTVDLRGPEGYTRQISPQLFEGRALRTLSEKLKELDPNREWGGLSRYFTSDKKYLWLCERHYNEYRAEEASYD